MKVARRHRRNNKKRSWMVAGNGSAKFEPRMMGIPEVLDSSHDDDDNDDDKVGEEDEEMATGIYRQGSSDCEDKAEDDDDNEGDLRYLPSDPQRRQGRQDDGSFPSFPAVFPQGGGDGSFPRMDYALSRVGPLATMFEGGSSAASSATGSDKGGNNNNESYPDSSAKSLHKNNLETLTASPASSSQTFDHAASDHPHMHPKPRRCSPTMRCLKISIFWATALLILCIVLIAVYMLRQGDGGSSSDLTTTVDKGSLGEDIPQVNVPTSSPTLAPSVAAKTGAPLATTTAPTMETMATAAPTAALFTQAPSLATPTLFPTNNNSNNTLSLAPTTTWSCMDNVTADFYINGILRNCDWLANSTFYQSLLCNSYNYMASNICPVTCQLCDILTAANATNTTTSGGV